MARNRPESSGTATLARSSRTAAASRSSSLVRSLSSCRKQNPGAPEPQRCRIEPRGVAFQHGVVELECTVTGLRQTLGVLEIAPRFIDRLRFIVERGILVTRNNLVWLECGNGSQSFDPFLNSTRSGFPPGTGARRCRRHHP